ncbi:MAG: hypothetical protein ACRDL7_06015, partial [Gaiellaceae bacterium]
MDFVPAALPQLGAPPQPPSHRHRSPGLVRRADACGYLALAAAIIIASRCTAAQTPPTISEFPL